MVKLEITSGVYLIKCIPTGERYVGSSKNIHHRFAQHLSNRRKNWNHKYDPEDYELYLLEETKDLFKSEDEWLKRLKPELNKHYNSGPPIHIGENNSKSIGSLEQYEKVILLGSKGAFYKDIAKEVGLSEGVCKSILNGQSHKYLHEKLPKEWEEIQKIKNKIIILTHPSYGTIKFYGSGVKAFEEYFQCNGIERVISGVRSSACGWKIPNDLTNVKVVRT